MTAFGKCIESLFGLSAYDLNKFMARKFTSKASWLDSLQSAFGHCCVGRWFLFSFKEPSSNNSVEKLSSSTNVYLASSIQVEPNERENFMSIYECMRAELEQSLYSRINFSNLSFNCDELNNTNSIIDSTVNHADSEYEDQEGFIVSKAFASQLSILSQRESMSARAAANCVNQCFSLSPRIKLSK